MNAIHKTKTAPQTFYFEVTDTYCGEANYTWVRRYSVRSVSILGALSKLSRHTGYRFTKTYDGEMPRYDAKNAAVCAWASFEPDPLVMEYFDFVSL
jgi:hypothetical protein